MSKHKIEQWIISRAALPMAQTSQVEGRLTAILQRERNRNMLTRKTLTVATLATIGVVLPLAALRPAARAQASPAATAAGAGKTDSQAARAQASPAATAAGAGKTDSQAARVLTQMAAAYKSLQTFSCTETAEGDGALGMPYHMDLDYGRPGRMAATYTRAFGNGPAVTRHFLVDGKALYETSSDAPGRYTHKATPERSYTLWQDALTLHADVKFPIMMELLEGSDGLLKHLTESDPHRTVTLGKPTVVDGVPVDTVVTSYSNGKVGYYGEMLVGRDDHLLRRITERDRSADRPVSVMSQTFTHVRADPALPADTFVFTPPAGAAAVEEHVAGADADSAAVALLVKMYAAYAALKTFSYDMEMTLHGPSYGPNGMTIADSPVLGRVSCAVQKPNRVFLKRTGSAGVSQAVCDGTTLYVTTTEPNGEAAHHPATYALPGRYLKLPLSADSANVAYNLSNFGGLGDYGDAGQQTFLPQAVVGWDVMPADGYDWKRGPAGAVNGEPVETVTLREGVTNDTSYSVLTLAISRKDHLLRRVTTEYHSGTQPVQQEFDTFTNVKADPTLPASLFVFTPPPGSRAVSMAADLTARR